MNEHVKSLAEQAGLRVESWMTNPPKPFQILGSTEQFEKFTELLLTDVTDILASYRCKVVFEDGFEYNCEHPSVVIKKRFT